VTVTGFREFRFLGRPLQPSNCARYRQVQYCPG